MDAISNKGQINRKIDEILDAVEKNHPFDRKNFVSMRKQAFLMVVGQREECMQIEDLLARERKKIIEEEQAVNIFSINPDNITGENLYQIISDKMNETAQAILSIDLYNVIICPVFLLDCFKEEKDAEGFSAAAQYVFHEMEKRGRSTIWAPYILLEHDAVTVSARMMKYVRKIMQDIIAVGEENHINCCGPCCVLSDKNEKGQIVTIDQVVKTIMMLTAFRNTSCKDEEIIEQITNPITAGEDQFFFSARAISICEPVRSLMLNRILAVHNGFAAGIYQWYQDKVYSDWKHCFFSESVWAEHLEHLVHDENHAIPTAPVYSLIPEQNEDRFRARLEKFGKEHYLDPLEKNEDQLLDKWWQSFWREYFRNQHGSLETLRTLEEKNGLIIGKTSGIPVKLMEGVYVSDARKAYEYALGKRIHEYPKRLMEKAFRPDGKYMKDFRSKKQNIDDAMEQFVELIQDKIRKLSQSELVFNTGGGHIANPLQEATAWFWEHINEDPAKTKDVHSRYENLLIEYFQSPGNTLERLPEQLLDIYLWIINGTIMSRLDYMKTKLENLAGQDMEQLISLVGQSWLYPIHLVSKPDGETAQKMYVMGSANNNFYRQIIRQDKYKVASKNNQLDDRLEIVRVSERFDIRNVFAKE